MSIVVTGAAGFVGANLIPALLARGNRVIGVDNLSRGKRSNVERFVGNGFSLHILDIAEEHVFSAFLEQMHRETGISEVWHLAANSDIPAGVSDAHVDLKDTFLTTFSTLEAMKRCGIRVLAFSSTSAIYGDLGETPLTEDIGPLFPISNYGAMKLASEAIITAAAESYLDQAYIFRFPNVVGVPATHGVVYDFVRKLRTNPSTLEVLGDGTQQKGYLHVEDLVDAMLFIRAHANQKVNCFNIGSFDAGATVRFIAEETVRVVAPGAKILYGEGNRGWVGDVPKFRYSVDKLKALGWSPSSDSVETMKRAIREIAAQENL